MGLDQHRFNSIRTPWGRYKVAVDDAGAEIWLGQTSEGGSITMNPTFISGCRVSAVLDYCEPDPEYGQWEANAAMTVSDAESVITRFQVTLVNMPEIAGFEEKPGFLGFKKQHAIPVLSVLPRNLFEVELCVLSMEPEVFSSEQDYFEAQADPEIQYAVNSFIPSGMMESPPVPYCFGAGEVLKSGKAMGLGGKEYCWAQVNFLDLALNVVWPRYAAQPAKLGEIIAYEGSLMAKVMNLPDNHAP